MLQFRPATSLDHPRLREMIIASFEPITWFRLVDANMGPLNGRDWRERWHARMDKILATEILLVGELDGEIVAAATGTYDDYSRLGFVDLLAVDQRHQGRGFGREMLRGMLQHFKERGAVHAHLECLSDNDKGNALYRSEGFQDVARSIKWFIKIP